MRARVRLATELGALLLGTAGCDLFGNVDELGTALFEPEPELLIVPGAKVAEGHFSELHVEYSQALGPVVRALNHDAGVPRLSFTTVDQGTCFAGEAAQAWSYQNQPTTGLVAYTETPAGEAPAVLRFAAYDCSEPAPPLPGARVVYQARWDSPFRGLVVLDEDGQLLVIDEETGQPSPLGTNVSDVQASQDFIWGLEGTRLVQYSGPTDRLELATGVSEFVLTKLGYGAYLEEGELYAPRGTDGSWNRFDDPARRTRLGSDVCSFGFVPRYDNVMSFFSPCETRRLNVWRALSGRDFEDEAANVYPLAENTIAPTPTGATLRVYLADLDEDIEIARNVTESIASELNGILYATADDAPGIHWARTR